ncbi:UDP:flavonoid glycosyltransferase YjiC (YdhE family) [Pseudoduganella flava]|nr:nucleotide disphospho-sugar-binding domain-containing protein [Pseudoduganella flava]TWI50076.1 UDP:flavonoid glycosyltransferase YjiC (YdhE family) [Pseudoduganella flava]
MKIGIQTWGSHGDIRPFLALGEGLQRAGHDVTLVVTSPDSACDQLASTAGVRIRVVASPVIDAAQTEVVANMAQGMKDPMKQMATLFRMCFAPAEDAMFAAARALAAESDLLIGHYVLHPLQIAAEQAGKPYVSVMLSHAGVPSAYNHPLQLDFLGKAGNRVLWWVTKLALNGVLKPYANRLRREQGMPLTRDVVGEVWLSRSLTLVAVSPQICERQPDWPETVQVCGFLDMPNIEVEGSVPAELEAFLAAGAPPVYMTMGSWMPRDRVWQRETLQWLTDAARLAGCRAIIQSPTWQDCGFARTDRVFYLSASPHHAIFPRCAAIVHHGGAGTTQSATLAGKPSIVVAHISEQEHWGRELGRIGVAPRLLKRRTATAAALAKRIGEVTADMTSQALLVSAAMRQDRGVETAVALIERKFGRTT